MKYIYKITGKVSLILYIFMLYQFWHLCQYGGLRRHIPMLALGIIGLVGTVVLWLISKRHNQEVNSGDNGNKKLFYTEMILLIAATLFFGGRIVYSAVPYHGALSWKLDEWMRKKEVELEHNNLFEDGVEGILMDLDEALQLPEELYIANKYRCHLMKTERFKGFMHSYMEKMRLERKKRILLIMTQTAVMI